MSSTTLVVAGSEEERALVVREQIESIRSNMHDGVFELAELLTEARDAEYHKFWGFTRFGDWIEQGSNLDMSQRTAYYLIKIIEKSRLLGISRETLKLAGISKLKEIFTLELPDFNTQVKSLVAHAPDKSLMDIKNEVAQLKTAGGIQPFVYITLKLPKSVKEETIDPAFELLRKKYGDYKDPQTGESIDITDGKCLEFIAVEFLQDPHNQPE